MSEAVKDLDIPEGDAPERPIRKRNPDESKRRILDAAEHAFARRGFDGARLRDIAQEAGVHHALVHHYYGDKQGLFKEVVQRALSSMSSAGLERLAGTKGLEQTVSELCSALFDFCSRHRDLLRIIEGAFRDRDSIAHQLTAATLGNHAAPLLMHIRRRIQDGQTRGTVRSDLSADAMLLFGFSVIIHPFTTGSGLLASLGVARPSEDALDERKRELSQYVVSAMRPQG
jgi:TetR/AcrR family transcriptional regulator